MFISCRAGKIQELMFVTYDTQCKKIASQLLEGRKSLMYVKTISYAVISGIDAKLRIHIDG